MKKTEHINPILLEPNYYYHLGFPFDLKPADPTVFEEGYHLGQFASIKEIEKGLFSAVRDPLGIGKIFYTETPDGKIHFSEKFADLFAHKSSIYSVPAGTMVNIGSGGRRELVRNIGAPKIIDENLYKSAFEKNKDQSVLNFRRRFTTRLEVLYTQFRELEKNGWTFFVALSGGLDSTIIASKAKQFLKNPIACTLDLGKSEDSEKSQKIASQLGIKHLVFPTNEEKILQALEKAPVLCQDFRDFNVHCAALNILLASNIKEYIDTQNAIDDEKVIILTGDLMNEFTCDYAGEFIDGVEYYKLPRVGKKALQDILISGLDTSDREISVFKAYGLNCIQPFAALYDLYASVPESLLKEDDPKKILNSFQVDSVILDFIPKTKLRAQVGSRENMGILGLCHHKGFNNKTFRHKIIDASGEKDPIIPIFAGRYDVEDFK
ncbi:asparagine synthase-related protein [Labilibaculum sp.]|uniref:asparagine synthase-related protein n=1 Tax=Labilibaculum sp. TaxID=2060723 RepID=UPI0035649F32